MILLLKIVIVFLLVKRGELFLDNYYRLPPKKTRKALEFAAVRKKTITQKIMDELISPLAKIIEPFIKMSEAKESKLKHHLARAGIKERPKEYYSKAITSTLLLLPIPALLCFVGIIPLIPVSIILIALIFYSMITSYKEQLKKKKEAIEMGLPNFIRSILYKLNDSKAGVVKADLISIFDDYLKVANPVFAYDISILIMEMKAKDVEVALRSFNNRLAIPEVSFLCNALIGITRGEHQNETLSSLAREMDIKSKENIRRELDKRPSKVTYACIPLAFVALVAIGYVLVNAMMGGISNLS